MSYEKPQQGNPHKLTINQHTFPESIIKRFYNAKNKVELFEIKSGKITQKSAGESVFHAKRAWDQKAESGFMKKIEETFESLTADLLKGKEKAFTKEENLKISEFFFLCHIRTIYKNYPIEDVKMNGATPSVKLTKDEMEQLEKKHVVTITPDGKVLGRNLTGINTVRRLDELIEMARPFIWHPHIFNNGELIVPDYLYDQALPLAQVPIILPIASKICLIGSYSEKKEKAHLPDINMTMYKKCQKTFFVKDISKIPPLDFIFEKGAS